MSFHIKHGLRLVLALLFSGLLVMPSGRMLAQDPNTIVVNRTEDAIDAAPGNGVCDADPNDKVLQCTLRAAIMEANARAGAQTILVPSGGYRLAIAGKHEDDSRTGDLDITSDLTITGQGATQPIIDAAGLDRIFHVAKQDGTQVYLQNLTLRGGDVRSAAGGPGGAVVIESESLLSIKDSLITDNIANNGGAVQFGRNAELSLVAVRVQNNRATDLGGGISASGRTTIRLSTISGNQVGQPELTGASAGGGLFAGGDKPIIIEQSEISGNTAVNVGGGIASAAIDTDLSLFNSTVSGNRAPVAGGIEVEESVLLQHLTIAHNSGGGLHVNDPNATVTLLNSIIANNGQDCTFTVPGNRLVGDRNLISDSSCAFVDPAANLLATNPLLGPLQFNHGQTQTHELLPGSPAIDGGYNNHCTLVDQRGVARPQGPRCDIGAFEAL